MDTSLYSSINVALLVAAPFIGSFLGAAAIRTAEGQPWVFGRSKCDACDVALSPYQLVPVLSYLFLRGRCSHCDTSIPSEHLYAELLAPVIAVWAILTVPAELAPITCMLGWTLLVLSLIDVRCFRLPDALTLPLIITGLVSIIVIAPDEISHHIVGAVIGFASLWGIGALYHRIRGVEGLGLGDAKLFAAAGAWVGWQGLTIVLLVASVLGIVSTLLWSWHGRSIDLTTKIPFGPFLALGIWATWTL